MTRYDIRLHTDKGVQIYDKGAECNPAEIPEMLACAVMDYLKDSPYPGAIQAQVMTDRRCTEYVLLLKDNSLDVYRHVEAGHQGGGAGASRRARATTGQGGNMMTHYTPSNFTRTTEIGSMAGGSSATGETSRAG